MIKLGTIPRAIHLKLVAANIPTKSNNKHLKYLPSHKRKNKYEQPSRHDINVLNSEHIDSKKRIPSKSVDPAVAIAVNGKSTSTSKKLEPSISNNIIKNTNHFATPSIVHEKNPSSTSN